MVDLNLVSSGSDALLWTLESYPAPPRLGDRELMHQLDTSRLDMKNLEEHLFFLEERRAKEQAELEDNKVSL